MQELQIMVRCQHSALLDIPKDSQDLLLEILPLAGQQGVFWVPRSFIFQNLSSFHQINKMTFTTPRYRQ